MKIQKKIYLTIKYLYLEEIKKANDTVYHFVIIGELSKEKEILKILMIKSIYGNKRF